MHTLLFFKLLLAASAVFFRLPGSKGRERKRLLLSNSPLVDQTSQVLHEDLDSLDDFHALTFDEKYATIEKIGSGSQGSVWLVKRRSDRKAFALKEIADLESDDPRKFNSSHAALIAELNALEAMKTSRYSVHMVEFFSPKFIVLELAPGGDMFSRLFRSRVWDKQLTPYKRRRIFKDLVFGVRDLHAAGFWYFDLPFIL
jgi:serine/threonine protein kinase